MISDCCGAYAADPAMWDIGICPECGEHCEFEDEDELEPEDSFDVNNNKIKEGDKIFHIHEPEKVYFVVKDIHGLLCFSDTMEPIQLHKTFRFWEILK